MAITTIGNNTGGTSHQYIGDSYLIIYDSHLAITGDVIRKAGLQTNSISNYPGDPFYILESATDDLSAAKVVNNYFNNYWHKWASGQYTLHEYDSDFALTAGNYYWVGVNPDSVYIAYGTGSKNLHTVASLDLTGVTAVGTTSSTTNKTEIWGEVINTAATDSVTVAAPDTGTGSLLQGESGITTIYYHDCSSIYGLITVNANGTFTSDRPGDQTFDYKLDGGAWQTCTINDQVDGI